MWRVDRYICLTIYMDKRIFMPMLLTPEQLFKALADSTRLRCLMLLVEAGELCVCELTYALDLIQPKISRHLAYLRETGLVVDRRQGQWIYYRIQPTLPDWAQAVLQATARGVVAQRPFQTDRDCLAAMPNRPGGACCA